MVKPWAFLCISLLLPLGSAQVDLDPDWVLILEDPSGDYAMDGGGATRGDAGDLKSLSVRESDDAIDLELRVHADFDNWSPEVWDVDFEVTLARGSIPWVVSLSVSTRADLTPIARAFLQYETSIDDQRVFKSHFVESAIDTSADSILVHLPKRLLIDEDGAPLRMGAQVGPIVVTSAPENARIGVQGNTALDPNSMGPTDRMPDGDVDGPDLRSTQGQTQIGDLTLQATRPYRSSNGEATTFLMDVHLVDPNFDGNSYDVRLETLDVPSQWTVRLPSMQVRMTGEDLRLPILVTTPFRHDHGATESFTLVATSHGTDHTELKMGIFYRDPALPSGHHDVLYLHSRIVPFAVDAPVIEPESWGFWSTSEFHDTADETPITPAGRGGSMSTPPYMGSWEFELPLEVPFDLGLDANLEEEGQLDLTFTSPVDQGPSELSGRLEYLGFDRETGEKVSLVLANFTSQTFESFSGSVPVSWTFQWTPEADWIPHRDLALLNWHFELNTLMPRNNHGVVGADVAPKILPSGRMTLPLHEYHDALEGAFEGFAVVDLIPLKDQERMVNAGETIVFDVELRNDGEEGATVELELGGSHAEWAQFIGESKVRLAPGATNRHAIAMAVPDGTPLGTLAEVFLEAKTGTSIHDLLQFRATVVREDQTDESDRVPQLQEAYEERESSAPLLLPLLAIVALAWIRRKTF